MSEQPKKLDEQAVVDLVQSKAVATFFQPLVSISTKTIVGFEAFSRGGGAACAIDSGMLFHDGLSPDVMVDVDRLCREKAFTQFKPIHDNHAAMLLFVNINPNIFPHVQKGSDVLAKQVAASGVAPENLVLECPNTTPYVDDVAGYVRQYGEMGYKACLDNCCIDDAFGQILSYVRPNFVKINRTFFANDERKEYSANALSALLEIADRIGATVVAQGVESEEESIRLLSAGVHLQQGYYYTKDENAKTTDPAKMFFQKIIDTYDKYKVVKREVVRRKKERFAATFSNVTSICSKFSNMSEDRFNDACTTLVHNVEDVISLFVLNNNGEQITDRAHARGDKSTINSAAILGMQKGMDHSVQDYVMYLDMGYEKFVTQPFTSHFTGENACIISRPFFNAEGLRYMVCIELPYPG